MKAKTFFPASRLAALALATITVFTFSACSGDDDEPSVDDILSTETTPIEFRFPEYDRYFMFDYAGNNYVGSDSVEAYGCTLDLRQGKHRLIWFKSLDYEDISVDWQYGGPKYNIGVHYNPSDKTLTNYSESGNVSKMAYSDKELEVSPYLLPTQQVHFDKYATGSISVRVTDTAQNANFEKRTSTAEVDEWSYISYIGIVKGFPSVRTVSIANGDSKIDKESFNSAISTHVHYTKYHENVRYEISDISAEVNILCPLNGINDIQLTAELNDSHGNLIPTTALPKCSLRRGYTTVLRGPLFSGSSADWTVTMEPYKN